MNVYDGFEELKDFTSLFWYHPKINKSQNNNNKKSQNTSVKGTTKKKLGSYISGDVQTGNTSFGELPDNL